MATERSRQLLLGAIVLVLAFVIYRVWPTTSAAEVPSSNKTGGTAPAARKQQAAAPPESPGVNLEALNADRPKPGAADRNLFRFKPKPPPPPPPPPIVVPPPVPSGNTPLPGPPPPPPGPPPITLKFIGLMESPTQKQKIAVLSDGRNAPFLGKEGDIIEGRYRILKIGVESIELAYADGRGRQTIRLTGS
jgi:hypothetical protein